MIEDLKSKIKLTRNNVIIEENTRQNEFILSPNPISPKNTGKIISLSPTVNDLVIGDNVFYSKYAGVFVNLLGKQYVLLSRNEIFGKVDNSYLDNNFNIGETTDLAVLAEMSMSKYMMTGKNLNLKNVKLQ